MENQKLQKLQNVLLEIMIAINSFCKENGLVYSLFDGTALGAVRHHGFIPWDDDVDLCMPRMEFERFKQLWKEKGPNGYYLQDPDDVNSHIEHVKIRKDGTILASKKELEMKGHHGIWVDIFAIDKLPKSGLKRELLMLAGMFNLVYTRDYPFKGAGSISYFLSSVLLKLPKKVKYKIRMHTLNTIKKTAYIENEFDWSAFYSANERKRKFPNDMFSHFTEIEFRGYFFPIVDCYEQMLTYWYGDYMQLPPQEERGCKHNPEIIDFGE